MKSSLFFVILCALLMALPIASAQDATPTTPAPETPFNNKSIQLFVEFDQQFEGGVCPEGSPQAAFCLTVTGTANSPLFGDLTLSRTLVADRLNKDEFNRAPIVSTGTLTDAEGDIIAFTLTGVLYSDGTTDYAYLVTGGTGKFEKAKGHGAVLILPPTSPSTGTEIWIGSLQVPHKRKS